MEIKNKKSESHGGKVYDEGVEWEKELSRVVEARR